MSGQPMIGRVIDGRFEIIERIGEGGYGDVYRAKQLTVDRDVALKLVHAHLADRADVASRFRREARLTASIDHRNAVRVIDFGEDDGALYLVMEYVPGRTLKQELRSRGLFDVGTATAVATGIAAALGAAHAAGVIHRDLKPSNVILADEGEETRPVVIDFGLVKVFGGEGESTIVTRSNVMIGTPAYMSPENVLGQPLDGRSDLYSLGLILFEMLSGRRPFRGSTPLEAATARIQAVAPKLDDDVPHHLRELVAELLAPDRADRPADARAVVARLAGEDPLAPRDSTSDAPTIAISRPVLPDLTVAPSRGPAVRAAVAAETAVPPASTALRMAHRRGSARFSWRGFALIMVAVTALAAAALLTTPADPGDEPTPTAQPVGPEITQPAAPDLARTSPTPDSPEAGRLAPNPIASPGHAPSAATEAPPTGGGAAGEAARPAEGAAEDDAPEGDGRAAEQPASEAAVANDQAAHEVAHPTRSDDRRRGTLSVNIAPYGQVFLDGDSIGDAPIRRLELRVGEYVVVTRYDGREERERVRIRAGRDTQVTHHYER